MSFELAAKIDGFAFEPHFLGESEARDLFARLVHGLAWTQPTIALFGVRRPIPRLEAWYGDLDARYRYSGIAHEPMPWTPELAVLRDRLRSYAGEPFNSVLANLYRDGRDSNGWHSDDEAELGPTPTIASLSLGATRRFSIKATANGERHAFELSNGSLLVMSGTSQQLWRHAVPKEPQVQHARINLTFRTILAP
ncbi:MAG: alpha-ketoglutarate-dependent dioxygenase AlkB [Candidatus Eremiobacteraeota bacterium]|nr:alpha-ketoglutarate-dependent dioxygenase AlkB [Candidatus Eremiobacteraeota bacterium]NNM91948.1 alpha-ketoglutarate-dependent dioxygenase AlkB [Candidatus Eremiobacteraeota bacterium]